MSKSKSKDDLEIMIEEFFYKHEDAVRMLAAKKKQKVVPAVLVTCTDTDLWLTGTMLRRSGRRWQHDLDDQLNERFPIKNRSR